MADDRLRNYSQSMGIDPATGKVIPKVAIVELDVLDEIRGVNLKASEIIQPVDIQTRYSKTVQTHSGVVLGPNGNMNSDWVDAEGYDRIALTLANSAGTDSRAHIQWSHDGSSYQGYDVDVIPQNTYQYRAGETSVKAKYFRVEVQNKDATTPRTMSTWAYLKV